VLAVTVTLGAVAMAAGCASEAQPSEEATGSSEEAVTVGATNAVCAVSLYLRSTDSASGPIIGTMTSNSVHGFSHFNVHSYDANTHMAYGYSYQLAAWGWANGDWLTTTYTETKVSCGYDGTCNGPGMQGFGCG
jgi:hypothetical protein